MSVTIKSDGALRYAVFVLPATTEEVYVAGTWNGWATDVDRLRKVNGRARRAIVQLDPGRHEFRFVTASGEWFDDEAVERCGQNCVVEVPDS